jgi:hypothetical protein
MANAGSFKKGEKKPNQGKRGPNKTTVAIKEMVTQALEEAGGVEYLVQRALDPRTASAFLTLVGKTLPLQVNGAGPNGAHVFQKIVVEVVKAK